jgi:hypothetical protein
MWPPGFKPCHDLAPSNWLRPHLLPLGTETARWSPASSPSGSRTAAFPLALTALSGTIENMHQRRLTLHQRVVLVVTLGAVLWVIGDWIIQQSSPFIGRGWTAYAPLTVFNGIALHPWAQAVLWLGLIAVWTIAALLILRESKPQMVDAPDGDHLGDDPTTTR